MACWFGPRGSEEEADRRLECGLKKLKEMGVDNANADVKMLLHGATFNKVRLNGWTKERNLYLSEDCCNICCSSRKLFGPKITTFRIQDLIDVQDGCQTDSLRQLVEKNSGKGKESALDDRAFSLIFSGNQEALSVVATSKEDAQHWVNGLRCLSGTIQQNSALTESYPHLNPY
uniref:1-phosphatidylinositol 4,5-bisphosphate phosphodiesterase delta-1-like n=1 Tax=Myxine glutinosa TaxID=7769 RepID=UPI00358F9437